MFHLCDIHSDHRAVNGVKGFERTWADIFFTTFGKSHICGRVCLCVCGALCLGKE